MTYVKKKRDFQNNSEEIVCAVINNEAKCDAGNVVKSHPFCLFGALASAASRTGSAEPKTLALAWINRGVFYILVSFQLLYQQNKTKIICFAETNNSIEK